MLIKEESAAFGGTNTTDSAYHYAGCDSQIPSVNKADSRHDCVQLCEACDLAPAAFICKADSASLCATCDADIHSANPLAHRHHRVPIHPLPGGLFMYGAQAHVSNQTNQETVDEDDDDDDDDEDEAASWLLFNNHNHNNSTVSGGDFYEYLEFVDYNQHHHYIVPEHKSHGNDSVVPRVATINSSDPSNSRAGTVVPKELCQLNFQLGTGYETAYNPSISNRVSASSMDVGIVPESTISEISISQTRPTTKTTNELLYNPPQVETPNQLCTMDREARVLRYREKKKTRKYDKTVRYASRKAYAETRPRIKGRFAKRREVEFEVDQLFCTSLIAENGYGIVPSY